MTSRTTLILDSESKDQLKELITHFGSQSDAIRHSIASTYDTLVRSRRRQELIDFLISEGGEPTQEDKDWAKNISMKIAASKEEIQNDS